MGLLNFKKRAEAEVAKYVVLRRMVWGDGIAVVGQTIMVSDPALARELVNAGKLSPLDDAAREHLKAPAHWREQPKNTASISPRGAGVFSRKSPWGAL